MNFAKVYSAQTSLLSAHIIDIEVDLSRGLHSFSIVGLPDKAVEESRDRVAAAIKNSGFTSPKSKNQKVVVSLAPADLKKEGPTFDLSIALAYLLATEDIAFDPTGKLFLGELSLDGELRSIPGILPIVRRAKEQGFREIFVPKENAKEAALIGGIAIFGASSLRDVLHHLSDEFDFTLPCQEQTPLTYVAPTSYVDFGDIKGQAAAKRALVIAASGGHNIALFGPPGTGKTLLAKALCAILPPLSFDEVLETTSIHSVAGKLESGLVTAPPFRSPHHTASYVALVGGGTFPKPGEITLAHRGVLFLDEFPEFDRRVIEALREPLEERMVSVSRARGSALFPADFILVAAMNPCPCGNYGSDKPCTCSPVTLERYWRKLSGPIMDRIDMWVEVGHVPHAQLSGARNTAENSALSKQVAAARERQRGRFASAQRPVRTNSTMNIRDLEQFVPLEPKVRELLNDAAEKLDLSPRAYHRVIKLSRTIADLAGEEEIADAHILEALSYRPKQKKDF